MNKFYLNENMDLKCLADKIKSSNDVLSEKFNKLQEENKALLSKYLIVVKENETYRLVIKRKDEQIKKLNSEIIEFEKNEKENNKNIDKNEDVSKVKNEIKEENIQTLEVNDLLNKRNLRVQFLGQKYFGIKFKVNNEEKILKIVNKNSETKDSFDQRKKLILEQNALNYNQQKKVVIDEDSRHKNNHQFQLYLNKGINLNVENLKNEETQTDITGTKPSEINNQSTIQSIFLDNSQNVNKIVEKLSSILEEILVKFNNFSDNNKGALLDLRKNNKNPDEKILEIEKNEELEIINEIKKIIEECDLIIKENENLKENVEKIKDRQECMVETYNEIFKNLNNGFIEGNKKIEEFLSEKKNISNEIIIFLKEIIEKNNKIFEEGKIIFYKIR